MKSAGIVRTIDELGRIVIPMEIRKRLDIQSGDGIEISVNGSSITLEKFSGSCIFCSGRNSLSEFHGKMICEKCKKELAK